MSGGDKDFYFEAMIKRKSSDAVLFENIAHSFWLPNSAIKVLEIQDLKAHIDSVTIENCGVGDYVTVATTAWWAKKKGLT
jgi:hypothetical protein